MSGSWVGPINGPIWPVLHPSLPSPTSVASLQAQQYQQQHQQYQQQHQQYQQQHQQKQQPQRPSPLPAYKYIMVNLARPDSNTPWGLTLSMYHGSYLILGSIAREKVHVMVRGYWAASPRDVDPSKFFQGHVTDVSAFSSFLVKQPCQVLADKLLPGDCILAMNGRLVAKDFHELSDATRYMRQMNRLHLVVLRDVGALQAVGRASASLALPTAATVSTKDWSCAVSEAAYRALLRYPHSAPRRRPVSKPTSATHPVSLLKTAQTAGRPALAVSMPLPSKKKPASPNVKPVAAYHYLPTNPLFCDPGTKKQLAYDQSEWEIDPDDGHRASLFLTRIDESNFADWLQRRKTQWRQSYTVHPTVPDDDHDWEDTSDRHNSSVAIDFWTQHGHASLQHWIASSTAKWKQSYSWNQRKRKRLEQDCEEVVQLTPHSVNEWVRVRKNQWRILRRKRQRQRLEASRAGDAEDPQIPSEEQTLPSPLTPTGKSLVEHASPTSVMRFGGSFTPKHLQSDMILIDALLEEQERERKAHETRPALDISFLFDPDLGCPDEAIVLCLRFLNPMEHGKLLCISNKTRQALMKRERMWRQLCPNTWKLPRRPRKPWHEIYLGHLRVDTERSQKRWDELLTKVATVLLKGDQVQSVEKLVTEAERAYAFDVNYSSGVVCERNSILNLAVIHQRHKVVRWLVETRNVDIETCDRGNFTPLLNAAWAGDKYLVRFLLSRGADRMKKGTCHYTRALAPAHFEGLTAEGWAEEKGYPELARLIRLGL